MVQSRLLGLVAGTLLVLLAQAGSAAIGPVKGLAWVEYPQLIPLEESKAQPAHFPDWDPAVIYEAEYSELTVAPGQVTGLLTCASRDFAVLTILFYSPQGMTYPVLRWMPVPPQQATTITINFPMNELEGLVRLIAWREKPDKGWLELLATQPNWTGEPVPGLLAERWFDRLPTAKEGELPWADPWRPTLDAPAEFEAGQWPALLAQVGSDLTVQTKDCTVLFNGTPSFTLDQYGTQGQWPLSWGADLTLVFEVGDPDALHEAKLYLFPAADTPAISMNHPPPEQIIELMVNGRWLPSYEYSSSFSSIAQPIAVSLSQYLVQDENRVRIRVTTFSTTGVALNRITLWTR